MADVNTLVYGWMMEPTPHDRLTRKDWITHGLRTIARQGAEALKVVPLAASLKVSRGSFYWHFKDIADYRAQLLQAWRERAADRLFRDIDAEIAGPQRLTQLMKIAFAEDRSLDRGLRAWALSDPVAAAAVAAVDASRITYIAKILTESGVVRGKAQSRAEFIYWAYIGQPGVVNPDETRITAGDIDDLSGLFTR